MVNNRRFNRGFTREKLAGCSCGGQAKLRSRKNYPFGRKSDSITSWFYGCKSCKKMVFIDKDAGGKR